MNTSLSWIKAYVPDLDVTAQEYMDAMTLSGTKVEGYEKMDADLDKIVVGQIDKITIIGGGEGGNGVDQVAGNVPVVMAKVFESMKEATGIDLADIINAESYDAQVNRNINVSGLDSVNLVVKDEKKAAEQPDAQDGATTE